MLAENLGVGPAEVGILQQQVKIMHIIGKGKGSSLYLDVGFNKNNTEGCGDKLSHVLPSVCPPGPLSVH